MPTFIAVQCFQCSTMQVKQQKKSSNKWSCVVCNEKQSVRNVFAQSLAAKDIRQFVQTFNMSRQLADKHQFISEEELETFHSQSLDSKMKKKKRTDWTEYIDDDQNQVSGSLEDEERTEGDGSSYPMVVTEMPKRQSKKPNYKENYSKSRKRHGKDQSKADLQLMNELRQTRSGFTRIQGNCSDEEDKGLQSSNRASRWGHFKAEIQVQSSKSDTMEEAFVQQPTKACGTAVYVAQQNSSFATKGSVSKWNSFITEEEEEEEEEEEDANDLQGSLWNSVGLGKDEASISLMNDERVEDDIHPDFL